MQIRLFITGGTFDKEYNELNGKLFFEDTHVPEMLDLGRCKLDVNIRTLMMIDSLEMSDEDRDIIAHNCVQCDEEKIVITHGTDTMVETAKILAEKITDNVQTLPTGIYIAMNGKYFNWNNVRKNKELGLFEALQ